MPVTVTTSSRIAKLDTKVVMDLCTGFFYIDLTPSIFIGSGGSTVAGVKIKITNPLGAVIKNFPAGYDIAGGASLPTTVFQFAIPKTLGVVDYGNYVIDVSLFETSSIQYTDTKTVNLKQPSFGKLQAGVLPITVNAKCSSGLVVIQAGPAPSYQGVTPQSTTQQTKVVFPSDSDNAPITTPVASFSVPLYEGTYKVTSEMCATYNLDNNTLVRLKYKGKREKRVACIIDECCVFTRLQSLHERLHEGCSDQEKFEVGSITLDVLRLLKTATLASECNEDPTVYIEQLEELIGCSCVSSQNSGVQIVNNTPIQTFDISGCGVTKTIAGTTTSFEINNYTYKLDVNDNGFLTVGSPQIEGCEVTLPINLNIDPYKVKVTASDTAAYLIDQIAVEGASGLQINNIGGVLVLGINYEKLCAGIATNCGVQCVAPVITTQPADVTIGLNQTINLSVNATGTSLTYQWQVETATNGGFANIPNATSSTLSIPNSATTHQGDYRVIITNSCGTATSTASKVTVSEDTNCVPASITTQPNQTLIVNAGDTISLSVAAGGDSPFTYQWQYNENNAWLNISGATSATLTIPNANGTHQGLYRASVTNACGTVTSDISEVGVLGGTGEPTFMYYKVLSTKTIPSEAEMLAWVSGGSITAGGKNQITSGANLSFDATANVGPMFHLIAEPTSQPVKTKWDWDGAGALNQGSIGTGQLIEPPTVVGSLRVYITRIATENQQHPLELKVV